MRAPTTTTTHVWLKSRPIFDRGYVQIQQPLEEYALVHRDAPLKPRIILAVFAGALIRLKS